MRTNSVTLSTVILIAASWLAVAQHHVRAKDETSENAKPVLLDRFLDVQGDHLKPLRDLKFNLEEATWDARKKQLTYKAWWKNTNPYAQLTPYRWNSGMCDMLWLNAAGKKVAETRDFKVTDTGAKDPKTGYLRVWLTIDFSDERVAQAAAVQINGGEVIGMKSSK